MLPRSRRNTRWIFVGPDARCSGTSLIVTVGIFILLPTNVPSQLLGWLPVLGMPILGTAVVRHVRAAERDPELRPYERVMENE